MTSTDEKSVDGTAVDLALLSIRLQGLIADVFESAGKPAGLTAAEALVVHRLSQNPSTVGEIARTTGLQANGASVLVGRLVRRGLLERHRSPDDQRVVIARLTDRGKAIAGSLAAIVEGSVARIFSPLGGLERQGLLPLLRNVVGLRYEAARDVFVCFMSELPGGHQQDQCRGCRFESVCSRIGNRRGRRPFITRGDFEATARTPA